MTETGYGDTDGDFRALLELVAFALAPQCRGVDPQYRGGLFQRRRFRQDPLNMLARAG
jgi:hypothetical protein